LHIAPVNDAPRLIAPLSDRYIDAEQPFDIALQANTVSDPDGDNLIVELLPVDESEALPDWLAFDSTGLTLQGEGPEGFSGALELRMRWSDAEYKVEDVFLLNVSAANAPPTFDVQLDDQWVAEDTLVEIAMPAAMLSDPDGDALSVTARSADGTALPDWLSFDGERFFGMPPENHHGTHEFSLLASDGQHEVAQTFVLTIEPAADAPLARDDGPLQLPMDRATEISAADLLRNDTDVDGDALRITGVSAAGHGHVTLTADGDLLYTPAGGYVGDDSFIYTVTDGALSATAEVSISISNPYADWDKGGDDRDMITRADQPLEYDAGDGEDRILAGAFDDEISGGDGRDIVRSGDGRDFVDGGGGADHIDGGRGNDRLLGGQGNDRVLGGEGDDELSGGEGSDLLWGGAGNDVFHFANGDGSDTVMDFAANTAERSLPLNGDRISLRIEGIDDFDTLLLYAEDNAAGVSFDFGNGDELFLRGTRLAALDKDAFSFF
jgi:Ca2+-binding RTX toxin-like protein